MTEVARRGDYSGEQWANATILHTGAQDSLKKDDHAIPVKLPDGTADPGLMRAAVRALANSGAGQEKVRDDARRLTYMYDRIDDNPPDSLKGLAGRVNREFSGEGFEETTAATQGQRGGEAGGAVTLADLDRQWVHIKALDAQPEPDGPLDPAKVDEFRRERGITMSAAYSILGDALEGCYQGDGEALRESMAGTEAAKQKAAREDKSLGQAAVELAGTSTEAGSERIAALADQLVASEEAQGREMDYSQAVVRVQREGYTPPAND